MLPRDLGRLLITVFSIASAFSGAVAQSDVRAKNKPNVVLILMDDVGYGDTGAVTAGPISTRTQSPSKFGGTSQMRSHDAR